MTTVQEQLLAVRIADEMARWWFDIMENGEGHDGPSFFTPLRTSLDRSVTYGDLVAEYSAQRFGRKGQGGGQP